MVTVPVVDIATEDEKNLNPIVNRGLVSPNFGLSLHRRTASLSSQISSATFGYSSPLYRLGFTRVS